MWVFIVKILDTFVVLQKIKKALTRQDGLSLVEAAIGLVVIGLLALPLIQATKYQIVDEIRVTNYGAIRNSIDSVNQFFGSGVGAYPCPASLTLAEGDANFGVSGDCTLANVRLCTDPIWPANEGICKTDNSINAIIIGGVPFATLRMPQEESLDYWGNKIIYTVTHKQTDTATYTTAGGEVRLQAVDDPVAVAAGTADGVPDLLGPRYDMFLFSTGSNGTGGYTKDGIAITACGDATTGFEHENCDFDNVFFIDRRPGVDAASARSEVIGVNYYDDWTFAQETVPIATWFQHEDNIVYPRDYVLTMATRVGVGTTNPAESLEVMGPIRSENSGGTGGRIKSDSICNDSDCFDPEIITGTEPSMNCATTPGAPSVVTEISNSAVTCNTATDPSGNPIGGGTAIQVDTGTITPITCAGGQRAKGFNASGGIVCVTP